MQPTSPDYYHATLPPMAVGRMDGWMNGWADMPRGDGLPKGWLYYARRFSARPGVKRRRIAPAVTILRRVHRE